MEIKVSVIVPVYNVEEYLEQCLDSIINQTLREIEIICVNDGSKDNSPAILEKYAQADSRIKIINKENGGLSSARNAGLVVATGEFIGYIDSDDWVDLDFFEKLYNAAKETGSSIAAASIIRKREYHQKFRVHYTEQKIHDNLQDKIDACKIPEQSYVWNKIYNRKELEETGVKFIEGIFFEDVRYTIQVITMMGRLVCVPDTYHWYRVNKKSIVKSQLTPKKLEDRAESGRFMYKYTQKHGIRIAEKYKSFTVKEIGYFGLNFFKVKENQTHRVGYIFGFLPVFKKKLNKV